MSSIWQYNYANNNCNYKNSTRDHSQYCFQCHTPRAFDKNVCIFLRVVHYPVVQRKLIGKVVGFRGAQAMRAASVCPTRSQCQTFQQR
jgi:hypothetical protein